MMLLIPLMVTLSRSILGDTFKLIFGAFEIFKITVKSSKSIKRY